MTESFDVFGIWGAAIHYAMILLLVGGAVLVFVVLWKNQRLDMDEEAKYTLFNDEETNDG